MRTFLHLSAGLLLSGLLLTAPLTHAQTTTKIKSKPGKGTVVKQKKANGDKVKLESDGTLDSKQGTLVGGGMMLPSRDIVTNASLSADHTLLVMAVKSAGLVETLQGAGPFTVFAPTNDAFNKLPAGTIDKLLLPESNAQLKSVLTYHVVAGRYTADDLKDGQTLTTVQGEPLKVVRKNGRVMITDGKGNTANVLTPNVISSNGITHVIDTVLMP